MRVLVIEDDREAAHFLQKALKESGHSAELTHDGEDGLSAARDRSFDVLIVDRMLPRLDGLSIVRKLRGEGVPGLLVCSATVGGEPPVQELEDRADLVVEGPAGLVVLLDALADVLGAPRR